MNEGEEEFDKIVEEMIEEVYIPHSYNKESIAKIMMKVYNLGFKAGRQYGDIDFLGKR